MVRRYLEVKTLDEVLALLSREFANVRFNRTGSPEIRNRQDHR